MPRIPNEKAIGKIHEYLQQLSYLQTLSYRKGESLREDMNISIRGFLPLAFDDGKEKASEFDSYVNSYIIAVGQEESPAKEQKDFEQRLRETKTFLTSWKEELEMIEDETSIKAIKPGLSHSKKIFIIHGHDEVSTLQLQKLLRDEWNLESLVLKEKPPRGRTLIEKFEDEAQKTDFAFAIYTADDTVKLADGEYFQARPNTIFELGWFYGRLGRNKVCILFKKGTKINSDLNGINTIEFDKTIQEKVLDIKAELNDVGII